MYAYAIEIGDVFASARDRADGFNSDNPSDLVKTIGSRMVDVDLALGERSSAIRDAADARMSEAAQASLRNPGGSGLLSSIRARFGKGS